MPSINVQELFERFMEDPDYIGKEELALAEAKQRAIQSMNNHKALSMAKAITPTEELLEFLIKKSVMQKSETSFWNREGKREVNPDTGKVRRVRFNPEDAPSHLVTPKDGGGTTHQDILNHLKDEILQILGPNVNWEDLAEDPQDILEGLKETGFIDRHKTFLDSVRPQEGKVRGLEAVDLLGERESVPEDGESLVDKLKDLITSFNYSQQRLQTTSRTGADKEAKDELVGDSQGFNINTVLQLDSAWEKPKGATISQTEWLPIFRDVVNRTLLDKIPHPDSDVAGPWQKGAHYITQGGEGERQLTEKELQQQEIQQQLRNIVIKLTGEEPMQDSGETDEDGISIQVPSARAAYDLLDSISKNPNRFLRLDEDGKPSLTQIGNYYYKTSDLNTTQAASDTEDNERKRDTNLLQLINHINAIDNTPNQFEKPEGLDTHQWHSLSPVEQWKLTFPQEKHIKDRLLRLVANEHQPDEPVEHAIDRVVEKHQKELNISYPEGPEAIQANQNQWDPSTAVRSKRIGDRSQLELNLSALDAETLVQRWSNGIDESERTGEPPEISNDDLIHELQERNIPITDDNGDIIEGSDRLTQEVLHRWATHFPAISDKTTGTPFSTGEVNTTPLQFSDEVEGPGGKPRGVMSTIYEQANMYDGEAGNQAGQLDPNYDGGGVTGMFGTFQPEAIDADQADLEEEAGLEDGDELDDPVEGEDGEVPEDGVVPTAEEGRLGADEVVGGGAQDFVQRGGNPRYKTDLSEAYAPKFKRNSPYDTCLLYTSPSPRDLSTSRMPSSA